MGVIERLSERCTEAFRCGTPILCIQTDSFDIIRAIVERDEMVVRLAGSKAGLRFADRPFRDLPLEKQMMGLPANYKDQDLSDLVPPKIGGIPPYTGWTCPHILTYHVYERDLSVDGLDETGLKNYVRDYLNPLCKHHDILRSSVILLYGSALRLSPSLMNYAEFIPVELPGRDEIRRMVEEAIEESNAHLPDNESHDYLTDITAEFSGFSREEVGRTMRRILSHRGEGGQPALNDSKYVFKTIRQQKEQRILGSNILKLAYNPPRIQDNEDAFQDVGALQTLRQWVGKRRNALRKADYIRRTSGASSPKGILVCGIPGCGKSLAATAVAAAFGLPLLQMDMGSLMDKYQGESERNMRLALDLAEAMSPCVLWIDELEKGFSGASAGQSGDTSFKRMFATMLNWMQQNEKPCFLYATANDIGGLPKEFFRSGRFDALFAAFLPTCEECAEIAIASMRRAEKSADEVERLFDPECRDPQFLAGLIDRETTGAGWPRILIGADINKLINQSLILYSAENSTYPIRRSDWERYLCRAFHENSVYGDGAENTDSIAVSYIRMLKKGFTPANSDAMFTKDDYLPDGANGKFIRRLDDSALQKKWPHRYDQAVYRLLSDRIDLLAGQVEQLERSRLIGG